MRGFRRAASQAGEVPGQCGGSGITQEFVCILCGLFWGFSFHQADQDARQHFEPELSEILRFHFARGFAARGVSDLGLFADGCRLTFMTPTELRANRISESAKAPCPRMTTGRRPQRSIIVFAVSQCSLSRACEVLLTGRDLLGSTVGVLAAL